MSRLWLASACFTLFLAACSVPQPVAPADDPVVYVVERGWHTDIGLPVEEITGPLAVLKAEFPGVRYFTFGFGERQFLVNRKRTFGAMLNALLPSQSALLLTALRATPQMAFGQQDVAELHVSSAGLERIEAAIWREFATAPGGKPMLLAAGPYPGSMFYAARDTYDLFFTCNTWTAETLRAGGLGVPATGVVFSDQVMGMARWIGARHASSR
jgi:uncharacterized protein (TIGR02117 family)